MKISDRLRLVREHFDLTQPSAATKFGIPLGTYKQYEKGPSEPGAGALRGLAEGGININWLLTGEGEMLLSDQAKDTETVTHTSIDTSMFLKVLERLSEDDFRYKSLKNPYIGYFAALIYSRVMSKNEEHRNAELEASIKELNLILTDQGVERTEIAISRLQDDPNFSLDSIISLKKLNDHEIALLGTARGKFANRMLSPGSQLEVEFLKGLALSDDSDQK
jgi:transcriptional regulator with XRE-family HTH domain